MNGILPPGVIGPAPPPPPPEGPLVVLARVLEQVPKYLFDFVLGLLIGSLTDSISTALTIAAVALGFVTGSWLIGLATFFFVYVAVRTVNNIAGAIGASGQRIAEQLSQRAPVILDPQDQ